MITGNTSKVDQVAPPLTPAIEKGRIVRFHELEATVKPPVVDDPAVEEAKSLGEHPAVSCSALIYGPRPGHVVFDDHVEHRRTLRGGLRGRDTRI